MATAPSTLVVVLGFAAACGSVSDNNPPPDRMCTGQPINVLENGAFDAPEPAWRQDPPDLLCGQPLITPASPASAACLGRGGPNAINTLTRDVPLPEGANSARLTGKICISTSEAPGAPENDVVTFEFLDGLAPFVTFGKRSNVGATDACDFVDFTLETPLDRDPEIATFRIQSKLGAGDPPTSFFIDSLELFVACR